MLMKHFVLPFLICNIFTLTAQYEHLSMNIDFENNDSTYLDGDSIIINVCFTNRSNDTVWIDTAWFSDLKNAIQQGVLKLKVDQLGLEGLYHPFVCSDRFERFWENALLIKGSFGYILPESSSSVQVNLRYFGAFCGNHLRPNLYKLRFVLDLQDGHCIQSNELRLRILTKDGKSVQANRFTFDNSESSQLFARYMCVEIPIRVELLLVNHKEKQKVIVLRRRSKDSFGYRDLKGEFRYVSMEDFLLNNTPLNKGGYWISTITFLGVRL